MTEQGFKVPADLAGTNLTLMQVHQIVQIRRQAKRIQNRIDALPAKKAALDSDLDVLRTREAAIKAGQPDPALQSPATPEAESAPTETPTDQPTAGG